MTAVDLAAFEDLGYCVVERVLDPTHVELARAAAADLTARHRSGDDDVRAASVSIGDDARRRPARNPGVDPQAWRDEPYIVGDLLALDERFLRVLSQEALWRAAARLLRCNDDEVRFHFCNLTRKPAGVGPGLAWHRDAENTYMAPADGRMLRLLVALQATDERNGATRVVARSHRHADSRPPEPSGPCPALVAGDALAVHPRVLHGGDPNRSAHDRELLVVQFGVAGLDMRCVALERLSLSPRAAFL
ncbi:phytanoyl-CoA dioxygenase family protein [Ramlibacter algicola]|uniref:Phytanoyl-CoA dioxygenase family protein n=1 Tax=Ramlibacter algicola TaxID=2795217 RepID=A0A934UQ84_9BURK|nr:phytanoyl-CoA dioxygenase family protein [Ramlibacter algicola]